VILSQAPGKHASAVTIRPHSALQKRNGCSLRQTLHNTMQPTTADNGWSVTRRPNFPSTHTHTHMPSLQSLDLITLVMKLHLIQCRRQTFVHTTTCSHSLRYVSGCSGPRALSRNTSECGDHTSFLYCS